MLGKGKIQFVVHQSSWRHLHILLALVIFAAASPVLAEHENEPKPDLLERTRSSVAGSLNYLSEKIDAFLVVIVITKIALEPGQELIYKPEYVRMQRQNMSLRFKQESHCPGPRGGSI